MMTKGVVALFAITLSACAEGGIGPSRIPIENSLQIVSSDPPAGATVTKGQHVRFTIQYATEETPAIIEVNFVDAMGNEIFFSPRASASVARSTGTVFASNSVGMKGTGLAVTDTKYVNVKIVWGIGYVAKTQSVEWPYKWVAP